MKILITAATAKEIESLAEYFRAVKVNDRLLRAEQAGFSLDFLITGVGQLATCSRLTQQLYIDAYGIAFQVGIAGSYRPEIPIGSVVNIIQEEQVDFGLRSKKSMFSVTELNLLAKDEAPYENNILINPNNWIKGCEALPMVKGATVNTLLQDAVDIELIQSKFLPDVESMEGASFFYVMKEAGILFYEIRAVSNMVGERDKEKWNVPLALINLTKEMILILEQITKAE